jgi:hypothetical protein
MTCVDYLLALHYNARREHPNDLRTALGQIALARRDATSERRRRRLDRQEQTLGRRLAVAEELARYDWAAGEDEFIEWVRGVANVPGVYERWRAHGVPLRVLRRAGFSRLP